MFSTEACISSPALRRNFPKYKNLKRGVRPYNYVQHVQSTNHSLVMILRVGYCLEFYDLLTTTTIYGHYKSRR